MLGGREHSELANAVRFLAVDMIQKANSGHPGVALGMADIATVLWREFLSHNPKNPDWINRDRFVLSNGHGSALLYALLHLSGYDLTVDDLQQFRQLHSRTPGHPEVGVTPGVEVSTGPLGQGIANAVGMAMAEKILAAQFNRDGDEIIDHFTYVFAGDGCLMEGISHEAASFAGTQQLGKLILIWDNNGISIDGATQGWFNEDVVMRFQAYHWRVIPNVNGHDPVAIRQAITQARQVDGRPTLIVCNTIIGWGSPNLSNSAACHGSPLGGAEIAKMRELLNWPYEPFGIPATLQQAWSAVSVGAASENAWQQRFERYQSNYPQLAQELLRRLHGELPEQWVEQSSTYVTQTATAMANLATRQASQQTLNAYAPLLPELLGGSADLTSSNLTNWEGVQAIVPSDARGNYLHYGVREFGMMAIMNGIALHRGFIPYGGTFLVFANYGHPAIRMAAMMKCRVIYVLTHDSIGLGEDGPSHQPVEQLAMLRATPNLVVLRPCDATETAAAWRYAIAHQNGPTALILSRQPLPAQFRTPIMLNLLGRGGYILHDAQNARPDTILIAAGSEVALAVQIARRLERDNQLPVRVVVMFSQELFNQQTAEYRDMVLPPEITRRVAIEAAASQTWHQYLGLSGKTLTLDGYGASAPGKILFELFGFSEENGVRLVADVPLASGNSR